MLPSLNILCTSSVKICYIKTTECDNTAVKTYKSLVTVMSVLFEKFKYKVLIYNTCYNAETANKSYR